MLRPQDLIININEMSKKQYLAVEVAPNFPYQNGQKSTIQDGFKTTVVMPALKFEKLIVKTPNGVPPVVALDSEIPAGGVLVNIENLTVTPYINNGSLGLSAKADSIAFAKQEQSNVQTQKEIKQ